MDTHIGNFTSLAARITFGRQKAAGHRKIAHTLWNSPKTAPKCLVSLETPYNLKVRGIVRITARQQQIINLLCQRRSDPVQNLAADLGVCERTIRRDIEELTLTYPLETVRGRYGGGVKMADWYFQDRPKLSPKQTALLKRLAVGLHGEDLDEMNHILARFAS